MPQELPATRACQRYGRNEGQGERQKEYELTLFADGRAIIKGTNEASVARNLYSKYVGA